MRAPATKVLTIARGYDITLEETSALTRKSGGDEYILEDEVVGIARWRCQHNNHGNGPMLEEASQRGIERLVTCPKPGEWEYAFSTELLDN